MKIENLFEHKKGVKAVKYTSKPRDPNTKTMQGIRSSGAAGAHTDKKKAAKQGHVKHKAQQFSEGAEFGTYTYEKLAQQIFNDNPNLPTSGRGDEFFNAAFPYIVDAFGSKKRANYMLNYDEDFPSDLISAYSWLQKQDDSVNEDWQSVNKRDKTDGMSSKAVKAYRREHPGSKLKTAVTTKPSKLKAGSKSAKRRKSFCARMSGMKKAHASAKTKRDPDSPINKALRRWNCESIEDMRQLIEYAEQQIAQEKILNEYGDTAKGQKMLTKVQKRAVDRMIKADDKRDVKAAKKNQQTANRAWDRMTDKDLEEQLMESLMEIKKGQKDSNGFTKCWPGKHAEGTKKGKNGKPVRNCVPNEGVNEQVGDFSSSNMQMSVDGARLKATTDLLRKKYGDNFQDKPGPGMHYDQEVKTIADPNKPGNYRSTVILKPKNYQLSPNISARPSMDPNQDFDYFHKGEQLKPDNPLFDKVKQLHLDSMRPATDEPANETRNPDLMSPGDYDRYQQNQMDYEKRDFKRREMEHELGDEDRGMYWVVIAKNGKWEYTKAQPRQEGMNAAQKIINALHAKYPNMHLGMQGPDGKYYNMGKGR